MKMDFTIKMRYISITKSENKEKEHTILYAEFFINIAI